MNTKTKMILIFTFGAVVGSAVTYFVVKEKIEEFYEELIQEELDSIRKNVTPSSEKLDTAPVNSEEEFVKSTEKYKNIAAQYGVPILHPVKNAYPEEDFDDTEEESDEEEFQRDPILNDEPYVITIDQFTNEKEYFDKITLYYYDEDEVLADDNEEEIGDVNDLIGEDALSCFGSDDYDEDQVFVRNEPLETDFEIVRLSKSYSDMVLS